MTKEKDSDKKDSIKKTNTNSNDSDKQESEPILDEIWQKRFDKTKQILNKMVEKKYPITLTIIIVIILLFTGYLQGVSHYSREHQLDTLSDNITSGITSKMAKSIVDSDGKSISEEELKPLKKLQKTDLKANGQIKTIIEHESSYSNFLVIKVGKYWGIYPKYKVKLKRRNIIVETNINDPNFKVNGKIFPAKKYGTEYHLVKSIPGSYSVNIRNKSGTYSKTRTIVVPVSGNCNGTNVDITMRRSPVI